MALTKGVNSYVDLTEANVYFEDRIDVAAWDTAVDAQKNQALITAARLLDNIQWVGMAVSSSQDLSFPRDGSYYDPKIGTDVLLDTSQIPTRIIMAQCELAYHLLNNDGLLDDTGRVENINIGNIALSNVQPPSVIPNHIRKMIKPLIINSGTYSWWRAN